MFRADRSLSRMSELFTINSRRFDGSIRRSWSCKLIERDEPRLVFVGVFEFDVEHAELGSISRGTISYEYYWLDRWYNVFAFFEPDGHFRNYYCNINMPPALKDTELNYIDLDLDVVVWPDGSIVTLDRDEYESNAGLYNYPPEVRTRSESALQEVLQLANKRLLPMPHRMR
jgi:protein associated with RNAse G/E